MAISPFGPGAITAAQIVSPYDIIFLSVKSYDLAAAIDDFAPAVAPRTVIIPALNGMHHMDVLAERFGENAVLGGVCFVATEIDSQGRIIQLADFQSLTYGPCCFSRYPLRKTGKDLVGDENINPTVQAAVNFVLVRRRPPLTPGPKNAWAREEARAASEKDLA
jgi:ketopantoate reductase